jgi:hypothetical protein
MSTENYNSNQILPPVSEYADGSHKGTMFDPIPQEISVKKKSLDQSSSNDLHGVTSSVQQEIMAQESER